MNCPNCHENTCRYHITSVVCTRCDASIPTEDLADNAQEALDEGIPVECPYCERPSLEFIVTAESCTSCDHFLSYEEITLRELTTGRRRIDYEYEDGFVYQRSPLVEVPEITPGEDYWVMHSEFPYRRKAQ